jgi:hypothetical protein
VGAAYFQSQEESALSERVGTDCHLSGRGWPGKEICSLKNSCNMLITNGMWWYKKIVKNFTKEY